MKLWATGWPDAQRQYAAGQVGAAPYRKRLVLLAEPREQVEQAYI